MKDPYIVLIQKEQDVARVRKEIQALLTVIPLLADSAPSWDELQTQLLSSCPDIEHSVEDDMAALELYYPFVRNLRLDGRLGNTGKPEIINNGKAKLKPGLTH